ncbi:ATP-dependent RNA helicase, partial [Dipsacomyces acuminosporus]
LRKIFGKETPEKIQAWREKIALCFIIVLITALTIMVSFGLSALFCHPVEPISLGLLSEKYGSNATQKLIAVRGRIYDVSDPKDQDFLGLSDPYYGRDSSDLFAPFPEETRGCNFWPAGMSENSCYSVLGSNSDSNSNCTSSKPVLDLLWRLRTNRWVTYQWNDVLKGTHQEKLFVYNEFVYSLKLYFASNITGDGYGEHYGRNLSHTLHDMTGTDATLAVSSSHDLQKLVPCWNAQLRLGRIEGNTVGCVITSSITISVTVVLNLMILIKLVCAVLFDWAFSFQLAKITKYFTQGSSKRIPHVLITVTCYNENEQTLRSTLESIASTNYA